MKILSPTDSLPPSKYQGRTKYRSDYDEIIEHAKKIEIGTHLPIEYESKQEVDRVRMGLIKRVINGDMSISVRGLTVYVTRNS